MATQRSEAFQRDSLLDLKVSGAVTASAAEALILDLGDHLAEGTIVLDVTALDLTTGDETIDIVAQGSPDAAFGTAGNIKDLVQTNIGSNGAKATDSDKDDIVGRYLMKFVNEAAGTVYRYLRLYVVAAGTTPSITFSSFLAKDD